MLVAAEAASVTPTIVVTKVDLLAMGPRSS
jgi:putative ribosome biogenesis GTPase RsgA